MTFSDLSWATVWPGATESRWGIERLQSRDKRIQIAQGRHTLIDSPFICFSKAKICVNSQLKGPYVVLLARTAHDASRGTRPMDRLSRRIGGLKHGKNTGIPHF